MSDGHNVRIAIGMINQLDLETKRRLRRKIDLKNKNLVGKRAITEETVEVAVEKVLYSNNLGCVAGC